VSSHPNVILMAVLTPDGLARKTMREILAEQERKYTTSDDVLIGEIEYHSLVMEDCYNEGFQIAAPEGSLVFFDMVTYGCGEVIAWSGLKIRHDQLERWCQETCMKHNCSYVIQVTANHW